MSYDVEEVYERILNASKKHPDIKFKNSGAHEAAMAVTGNKNEPFELKCEIKTENGITRLYVNASSDTFGPQPYLAIKTKGGRYFMDNFDFQVPKRSWTYTFDEHSVLIDDVDKIGIASNSANGAKFVYVLEAKKMDLTDCPK